MSIDTDSFLFFANHGVKLSSRELAYKIKVDFFIKFHTIFCQHQLNISFCVCGYVFGDVFAVFAVSVVNTFLKFQLKFLKFERCSHVFRTKQINFFNITN